MRSHVDLVVSGVNLKATTHRFDVYKEARSRGIYGFIRFDDSGSIAVSAEGETEDINRFIEWCRSYFPREGNQVEIQPGDQLMDYNDFIIRE